MHKGYRFRQFIIHSLFVLIFVNTKDLYAADFWTLSHDYIAKSPDIQRYEEALKTAQFNKYTRFLPRNPSLTFISNDDHGWTQSGLTLSVPFPGRVFTSNALDVAEVKAAEIELKKSRQSVLIELAGTVLDCLESRAKVTLFENLLKDQTNQHMFLKAQYTSGFSSQTELILSEVQLSQMNHDYKLLMLSEQQQCTSAKKIYSIENDTKLPDVDLNKMRSFDLGKGTLNYKAAQAAAWRSDAQAKNVVWEQTPDFNLFFLKNKYLVLETSPYQKIPRSDTLTWGVSLSLPVFWPFQENREIRAKRAEINADIDEARRNQIRGEADAERSYFEFKNLFDRLSVLEKIDIPLVEKLKNLSLQNYRNGKISFAELSLARKAIMDVQQQYISLKSRLIKLSFECGEVCTYEKK